MAPILKVGGGEGSCPRRRAGAPHAQLCPLQLSPCAGKGVGHAPGAREHLKGRNGLWDGLNAKPQRLKRDDIHICFPRPPRGICCLSLAFQFQQHDSAAAAARGWTLRAANQGAVGGR